MYQLVLHLFGDFVFQNDWMATNKHKYSLIGWLACVVHCFIYSLLFLNACSLFGVSLIFASHFVIDKFSVAKYWTATFKIGARLVPGNWLHTYLIFMVDMCFHLACNHLIIMYGNYILIYPILKIIYHRANDIFNKLNLEIKSK